jgi:hypothetical protein
MSQADSDVIKRLDILSQDGRVIGIFGDKTIIVYPPSISRYKQITKLISELPDEVQEFISQAKNSDADINYRERIELFRNILDALADRIAPVVVAMTSKPVASGKWEPVITHDQVENDLTAEACLNIFAEYEKVAAVPELSKKMNTLSQ